MSDLMTLLYSYLSGPRPHALQLGCGWNPRPGWLNTDMTAREGIVPLDVTRRFPLPDACVDHVYSEHMIEHMPFEAGQHMLHECFRVLRSSGVVRTTTPSINFLIRLCLSDRTQLEDQYGRLVHFLASAAGMAFLQLHSCSTISCATGGTSSSTTGRR